MSFIEFLIFTHAGLGGVALLSGLLALIVVKGSPVHKKSGKVFFFSMLLSAAVALIIAFIPSHHNPFLVSIGIFSTYFLLSGFRSLRYKQPEFDLRIDKAIAAIIVLTGVVMIFTPILLTSNVNVVLLVFGTVGIVFGLRDFRLFKNRDRLKKNWLKLHLGKMTGGYIAAVSAFFVVNQVLPGIWNWFVPGIVGSAYISFWMLKLNERIKG
jgi:uncharacterized membrane protein